tara:strand:+ start:297 stop:599 length:303 start_codon:yes stop_codon:yes gene_type:complete
VAIQFFLLLQVMVVLGQVLTTPWQVFQMATLRLVVLEMLVVHHLLVDQVERMVTMAVVQQVLEEVMDPHLVEAEVEVALMEQMELLAVQVVLVVVAQLLQ